MRVKLMNLCALLLMLALVNWFVASEVRAGKTEKYHGMIIDSDQIPGYNKVGTSCIPFGIEENNFCALGITTTRERIKNGNILDVVWLQEKYDTTTVGIHKWRICDTVEIEHSRKDVVMDDACKYNYDSNTTIIAYGTWTWRKHPGVGGYMRPVKMAWRVDVKSCKFVRIPVDTVTCEDNEGLACGN